MIGLDVAAGFPGRGKIATISYRLTNLVNAAKQIVDEKALPKVRSDGLKTVSCRQHPL
jgi:hypothetical protein